MKRQLSKGKRLLLRVLLALCCLICVSLVFFSVDVHRAKSGGRPIFSFPALHANDGGTTVYFGLGYEIIQWHRLTEQPGAYQMGVEEYYLFGMRIPGEPLVPLQTVYPE